jgi:hypothetical protein
VAGNTPTGCGCAHEVALGGATTTEQLSGEVRQAQPTSVEPGEKAASSGQYKVSTKLMDTG